MFRPSGTLIYYIIMIYIYLYTECIYIIYIYIRIFSHNLHMCLYIYIYIHMCIYIYRLYMYLKWATQSIALGEQMLPRQCIVPLSPYMPVRSLIVCREARIQIRNNLFFNTIAFFLIS